jgi:hypothetical protein
LPTTNIALTVEINAGALLLHVDLPELTLRQLGSRSGSSAAKLRQSGQSAYGRVQHGCKGQ